MTRLTPHRYTNTVVEITACSVYIHIPKLDTLGTSFHEIRKLLSKFKTFMDYETPAISSFIFLNHLQKKHYF